jgi:hypothetical protein
MIQQIKPDKDFVRHIKRCRIDPAYWVDCTFESIKLSNQQRRACDELGKIVEAKLALSLGMGLTDVQKIYSKYIGIDISSGMGTGKDFWLSLMMFWLLSVFPIENNQPPHGLATANTATQLTNVLWKQASVIPSMSKKLPDGTPFLETLFVCQQKKIYRKEFNGRSYFFEGVTVNPNASSDEQARALTGRHAPYMIIALDEAAGIPDPVFENLEGTLTGRMNLLIMIYNPIKSRGYAVEAREKPDRWLSLNWNAEDTVFGDDTLDLPLQNRNRDLLKRYGRDSNTYRIRVLGLPPVATDDVFFPWEWVQNAVENGLEPDKDDPITMGVDPAAGGDNSVIVVRQGCKILGIQRFVEPDTMNFAYKVKDAYYKWDPITINVDTIGVGRGVADRLREWNLPVYYADVRRTARDKKRCRRVRDELWIVLRDKFEKGLINVPNDQELIDQLGNIKIKDYAATGVLVVPTKAQMKKDIGHSPDEADGICLTYAIPDEELLLIGVDEDELYPDEDEPLQKDSVTGY